MRLQNFVKKPLILAFLVSFIGGNLLLALAPQKAYAANVDLLDLAVTRTKVLSSSSEKLTNPSKYPTDYANVDKIHALLETAYSKRRDSIPQTHTGNSAAEDAKIREDLDALFGSSSTVRVEANCLFKNEFNCKAQTAAQHRTLFSQAATAFYAQVTKYKTAYGSLGKVDEKGSLVEGSVNTIPTRSTNCESAISEKTRTATQWVNMRENYTKLKAGGYTNYEGESLPVIRTDASWIASLGDAIDLVFGGHPPNQDEREVTVANLYSTICMHPEVKIDITPVMSKQLVDMLVAEQKKVNDNLFPILLTRSWLTLMPDQDNTEFNDKNIEQTKAENYVTTPDGKTALQYYDYQTSEALNPAFIIPTLAAGGVTTLYFGPVAGSGAAIGTAHISKYLIQEYKDYNSILSYYRGRIATKRTSVKESISNINAISFVLFSEQNKANRGSVPNIDRPLYDQILNGSSTKPQETNAETTLDFQTIPRFNKDCVTKSGTVHTVGQLLDMYALYDKGGDCMKDIDEAADNAEAAQAASLTPANDPCFIKTPPTIFTFWYQPISTLAGNICGKYFTDTVCIDLYL